MKHHYRILKTLNLANTDISQELKFDYILQRESTKENTSDMWSDMYIIKSDISLNVITKFYDCKVIEEEI